MTRSLSGSKWRTFSDHFSKEARVDILDSVIGSAGGLVNGLVTWHRSTYMCSPASHAFLYVLIASSTAIALGGVYVWRRFIRTQPKHHSA